MKRSLPATALARPITVIMVVITMVGLGVIAYTRIPLELIPKLEMPFIRCVIPYVGATPAQVENDVAIPAEGEFRTVSQLKRISTTSDMNGCDITMLFEWDADLNEAMAEVRDRMERLKLRLPSDVDQMFLRRFSSTSLPIMAFALFREGDKEELTYLVQTLLQSRLLRIEGVADVKVFGAPEKEVLIEFDQDALRSCNLSLYEVVGALQRSNINVSIGELDDGSSTHLVRVEGEFRAPEEIAQLVVGPDALRLRDVAEVGYRAREIDMSYSIDGKAGVFVLIRKESEENTITACKAVHRELDRMRADPMFKGTDVFMFIDQSALIQDTLDGMLEAGKWGGGLAILVLFLFLRRIRPTLVVALAIPASLVVAFVFMFFVGMTLNLITMISMIIALGMLVDNSIVVMENIDRYSRMGYSAEESARRGATEVGLAITAATMTTLVVFVPILYLQVGEMATYMRQFAAPVSVSLMASLVIALTVIPLAVSRIRPRHTVKSLRFLRPVFVLLKRLSGRLYFPLFDRIMKAYVGGLRWTTRWRLGTLMIVGFMVILTLIPACKLDFQGRVQPDTRQVQINVNLDQNFDKEKADGAFDTIHSVIAQQRDELGVKSIFSHHTSGGGSFYIYLVGENDMPDGVELPYTTEQVRDILWQRLPSRIPGAELQFSIADASETSRRGFTLRMRGDDAEILNEYAQRFKVLLSQIPNVRDVIMDIDRNTREIQIQINEDLAEQHGVSPLIVAQTVDFALRGAKLSYLKREGREIPVWAQFREEDRKTRANLDKVAVPGTGGELVPLQQLVTLEKARSPRAVNRVDGKNVVTIMAKTIDKDMAGVIEHLKELMDAYELPPGYEIQMGDELLDFESDMSNFILTIFMAVILIYLVMGALFESYLLPLSILTTVGLAGIGVVWVMFLTSTPMDLLSFIGCILLVGIVVNNGIVIIDHINQLRKRGLPRDEAILQAGQDRFRPVLMTALTTILGCVPLASGMTVAADLPFYSMGRALIGGLVTATVLTLFVVPVFYSLIDDFALWCRRYFAGLVRAVGKAPAPEA